MAHTLFLSGVIEVKIVAAVVLAVFLIVGLYLGFFSNQESSLRTSIIAKVPATSSESKQGVKPSGESARAVSEVDVRPIVKNSDNPTPSSLYTELANSRDFAASLARLRAMPNNPTAQYLTTLVVSACGLVLPEYLETFKQAGLKRIGPGTLSKEFAEKRNALIDREAARCAKVNKSELNEIGENRFDMITKSAQLGDTYARAELVGLGIDIPSEFRKQLLSELPAMASTRDPFILNKIADFFSKFQDRDFDMPNGSVTGHEIRLAFQLLACQHGENCGADARRLEAACINLGRCGSNSLLDYFQTYELTPARAVKLEELQKLLEAGIATGTWPPGLWPTHQNAHTRG